MEFKVSPEEIEAIKAMTKEVLESHLITLDYRGREYKREVLNILLQREYDKGYQTAWDKVHRDN